MSSLRLALKQSLQETGHLAPKEKKKKKGGGSAARRRPPRQPGEPPRKRGRPPKHPPPPVVEQPPKEQHAHHRAEEDDDDEHSSENEFSYDSEESHDEEEEDDEEEDDDDEDEESHEEEDGDDHEEEHPEEDETGQNRPLEEEDEEEGEAVFDDDVHEHRRRKKLKKPRRIQQEEMTASDEERRLQRKLLKKQLKHSAANKIQTHWKLKRAESSNEKQASEQKEEPQRTEPVPTPHHDPVHPKKTSLAKDNSNAHATVGKKKRDKLRTNPPHTSSKSSTVPPPTPEVLEWTRSLSERKCRKHVASGMRVKVRFATKVKREGKVIKKKIWYGGRVSAVSKEGSKIRIKYDDGTSEISKFPDKDVVVDESFNGQHLVSADRFIPPSIKQEELEHEDEEEEFADNEEDSHPVEKPESPKQSANKVPTSERTVARDDEGERKSKNEESSVTPVKPTPDALNNAEQQQKPLEESAKVVETTPVSKVTSNQHGKDSPPEKPRDLGSPEEGELSPGLSFPNKDLSRAKPAEVSTPDGLAAISETQSKASPTQEKSSDIPKDDSRKESEKNSSPTETSDEPAPAPTPKPSLTIRISNIKSDDRVESLFTKKTRAIVEYDDTSEEELFADTPVTQRKMKSIEIERIREKNGSRKRSSSDASAEAPLPKRRIHLKRDREVAALESFEESKKAIDTKEDSQDSPVVVVNKSSELEGAVEALSFFPESERIEEPPKKESKTMISLTLRRPASDEMEEELLVHLATKPKRKKGDRATSPNPRGRRSPVNNRRSPVMRIDSPSLMANEQDGSEVANIVVKPVSKPLSKPDADSTLPEMATPTSKRSLMGSKNSAFARKQPGSSPKEGQDILDLHVPSLDADEQDDAEESGPTLTRSESKASIESLPSVRSGRRAAQQAKEKMNPKQEPAVPESGKKKKKRGRKEGKDGDGDDSEDDRQWVQCDKCAKWRILPSTIKASSLPKHWYCHLNVHDPKRHNCSAPEQTPKQVAKERRRAKKRARLQRLEQGDLEAIQEDSKKDSGKDDRPSTPTTSPKTTKGVVSPKPAKGVVSPKPSKGVLSSRKLLAASGDSKKSSPTATEDNSQDSGSDSQPKVEKKAKKGRPPSQPSPDSGSDSQTKVEKKAKKGRPPSQQSQDSGSDSQTKVEKKAKKGRPPSQPPQVAVESQAIEKESDPKVKVGRRRGRPARNAARDSQEKKDDDNVEWVQCEKCEKWRKLPPDIGANELPDVWYCTMNDWNPDSANCESPEDKADALHQEIGTFPGQVPQGMVGKFSYRSLIFGTGRKHNRPMSERTRASESLFMMQVDDDENPHPTVMYSKSSAYLPRISNFTKSHSVEEKTVGIFDVLSNSDLFGELRGVGQPMPVLSSNGLARSYPKFLTFENLPDNIKQAIREGVLRTLGSSALSGEDVIREAQCFPWETLSIDLVEIHAYLNADVIINTILALVRGGAVEMTCLRDPTVAMSQWIPKYRKVRSRRDVEADEAMQTSRCMKISKPWKQKQRVENSAEWITGGAAFA